MKRVHLIISGDVQGVGFRSWTLRYVKGKPLTGWVKNRDDGTVEITAEGSENDVNGLIQACKSGPEVAWVKHIDVRWTAATNEFFNFEVIY